MTTYHEPQYLSDVLLTEVAKGWTTQTVKIKTATALAVGTILYQSSGQDFLTAETTDFANVVGILASRVEPSDSVQKSVAIVRGAVVATHALIFPAGANTEQKKQTLEVLNAHGIVTDDSVLPINAMIDEKSEQAQSSVSSQPPLNIEAS